MNRDLVNIRVRALLNTQMNAKPMIHVEGLDIATSLFYMASGCVSSYRRIEACFGETAIPRGQIPMHPGYRDFINHFSSGSVGRHAWHMPTRTGRREEEET
jgi:hypothetical protein